MQINSQPNYNINFSKLFTADKLKETIRKGNCSKQFVNQYIRVKKTIWKSRINTLDNVNIILNYENGKGYTAIICSNKSDEILNQNAKFFNIVNTDNCIKQLKEWGEYWNNKYVN